MPFRLEIKRKLCAKSDRVKSVDIHPTEPWLLASLYNGNVYIWNYKTETLVKSFEISQYPVRCSKFIARKQWIITGSDDMLMRVYNYNTMAKIKTFEGHTDYIRCIAVHPTQPLVLTSSDDMLIKLWNWDKQWQCVQVFEGHSHYVMMVAFNPKDTNTFASASLDRTIRIWGLGNGTAHYTLEGHDRGVNCVDYFTGGDKPYLVSGADDRTVKVWDYQNKTCVQTLEGHANNVSVVCYHPTLPVIISGSEDSTVRIWNSNTYRLEKTLNYGMDRVWALAYQKGSNKVAIGYDEGAIMIKLGREEPAVSMASNGKIIWAKHSEIQQTDVKTIADVSDGERLAIPTKELGNSEVFPQMMQHNNNGRFVVVCGDGEFIIYTALAWRNKSFGSGLDFVWGIDTGEYGVRESTSKVKIFNNFKEVRVFRPSYSAEGIFGGQLLAVRGGTFVCFYDWQESRMIRRIDVVPKSIYWNDSGELLVIATDTSFFILKYNRDAVAQAFEQFGDKLPEDGIESAFEVLQEFGERVRTGIWVGDCFIYTNSTNRLNYCVGSEIVTVAHLDRTMYLLGYMPKQSRLYLTDKSMNLVSYGLELSMVNYQTAILRQDFDAAAKILPIIPTEQRNRIAQFLESQGLKEQALEVATDPDLKFDLAVNLGRLEDAYNIARESDTEQKWRQLADLAIAQTSFGLAEECLRHAQDLSGLLLFYSSTGNSDKMLSLGNLAAEQGKNNIAFICYFLLGQLERCLELLCSTKRVPEAAFLARSFLPSHVCSIVKLWQDDLKVVNQKAANSLADPEQYPNLFPDFDLALKAERIFRSKNLRSASEYPEFASLLGRDLISEARDAPDDLPAEEPKPLSPSPSPALVPIKSGSGAEVPPASPLVKAVASESPVRSPVLAASESPALSPVVASSPAPASPARSPVVASSPAPASPVVESSPAPASPAPATNGTNEEDVDVDGLDLNDISEADMQTSIDELLEGTED